MTSILPKHILFLLFATLAINTLASDTLRVMHYNLLYYGANTTFCTSSNNNSTSKEYYLRTILAHDLPDIFTVNEISSSDIFHQRILTTVLSQITTISYSMANCPNLAGSNIVNMLYYNNQKLTLHNQEVLQSMVRDIDLYTLYYNSPELQQGDTVYLHCIVAHLKAGNTSSDQQQRSTMTLNALNYLHAYKQPGNYLFLGDLNLYNSSEPAFQNLLYYSITNYRFYDPINQVGSWSGNASYSNYHTQSTRTSSSGCHSTGGMDDRFDFILISNDIRLGYDKAKYIVGSYRAMGQDGQRLNKSLLDSPFNSAAPLAVLEALYYMSDHLPVLLSIEIDQEPAIGIKPIAAELDLSVTNPVEDILLIHTQGLSPLTHYHVEIISLQGAVLLQQSGIVDGNQISIPVRHFRRGFYLVNIRMLNSNKVLKVIKL
ncbi:MAG: T9SS type A sorting domain-containing protein [Bacteroidales bacterium]|nr:T9SS type A sorting domain-containing protein [Bacteroidales bacterium]MDZ4203970.1 T9SS type A sorting domain-containing protein [Bacteroidales bacterium]